MRTTEEQVIVHTYQSGVIPEIVSSDEDDKDIIEWADQNPVVWHIVMHNKSKAFGKKSCEYIGWAQDNNSEGAIIQRVRTFKREYEGGLFHKNADSDIFVWRAQFTFNHYKDKGFKGGVFKEHDEHYPRGCLSLDYTPETLEEVIDKFYKWCGGSYNTQRITVDDITVRTFQPKEA